VGFNYEDAASRWWRGRTLSAKTSDGLGPRLEMRWAVKQDGTHVLVRRVIRNLKIDLSALSGKCRDNDNSNARRCLIPGHSHDAASVCVVVCTRIASCGELARPWNRAKPHAL
jgi:hypothetical protein